MVDKLNLILLSSIHIKPSIHNHHHQHICKAYEDILSTMEEKEEISREAKQEKRLGWLAKEIDMIRKQRADAEYNLREAESRY